MDAVGGVGGAGGVAHQKNSDDLVDRAPWQHTLRKPLETLVENKSAEKSRVDDGRYHLVLEHRQRHAWTRRFVVAIKMAALSGAQAFS
ncbi:hypothetical protein RRG08_011632 [Elysia crispata]|uniref:Uncharacterized protein n=1 Tax=Elysia crispata TaxID=231223 RepID=A0AAE0YW64_9GAST|nr:hypothetical protein RRG08_011632 [Elysia crispata]